MKHNPLRWLASLILFCIQKIYNFKNHTSSLMQGVLSFFPYLFLWCFSDEKQARMMHDFEKFLSLNSFHKGFLIDGKSARLSEETSFESIVTTGGMGKGKSSVFVIPNIFTLLENNSLVLTDISGDLFKKTSGYVERSGRKVKVLNLMDVTKSNFYNPLANANTYTEIAKMAHLLIQSAQLTERDQFWATGAQDLIRIIIQALKNKGETKYINLANVKHLLNNFDVYLHKKKGVSKFDKFILENTIHDQSTFSEYKGITHEKESVIRSYLSTAKNALSSLGNPELQQLTSFNEIDFKDLRKEPTVLYVMVHEQDMELFSFLLNLFYADLFRSLLSSLDDKQRPVYLILDEFGHLKVPNFPSFAGTARKFKVGYWLFLQSLSQLESRYGGKEAETILGSLYTELYFGGLGIDTAKTLERKLGRVRIPYVLADGTVLHHEENLMNEDRIVRIKKNRVLAFLSEQPGCLMKVKRYYKHPVFKRYGKMKPAPMPETKSHKVEYLDLG